MTAASRQRLFFALWPDDETRGAFARLASTGLAPANGRLIAPSNLHLTLEFLGNLEAELRERVELAADTLSAPAFELEFQRLGYWPRPRVLWSAPERTPEALTGLVTMLRRALVACGHKPESREFRAHVTLARKVRGPVRETAHVSVRWSVYDIHLVASERLPQGARYRPIKSWPLG